MASVWWGLTRTQRVSWEGADPRPQWLRSETHPHGPHLRMGTRARHQARSLHPLDARTSLAGVSTC